ncbi:MAG: hypothetical protein GY820_27970 [Gammaproteobacteria bacterium]|nr:hypothetical protein [Gammaproteobacteria bacterium]
MSRDEPRNFYRPFSAMHFLRNGFDVVFVAIVWAVLYRYFLDLDLGYFSGASILLI